MYKRGHYYGNWENCDNYWNNEDNTNNEVNVVYGDDDVEKILCLPVKNEDAQVEIKSKCYSKEQLLYYIRNRKTLVKKLMK